MLILLTFFIALPSQSRADVVTDAFQAQGQALEQYTRALASRSAKKTEIDGAQKRLSQATRDLAEAKHHEHGRATDSKSYSSMRTSQPSRLFAKSGRTPANAAKSRFDAHYSSRGSSQDSSPGASHEEVVLDGSKIPKVIRFRGRE